MIHCSFLSFQEEENKALHQRVLCSWMIVCFLTPHLLLLLLLFLFLFLTPSAQGLLKVNDMSDGEWVYDGEFVDGLPEGSGCSVSGDSIYLGNWYV
jgi:hypothetical protein